MKKLHLLLLPLLCATSLFATEPTKEQKQAVFMMNYAQYVTYKLKTYNNILALEEEYENLKDNMNYETIKDSDSVETINRLMESIHTERKNNQKREKLKKVVERRMDDALFNSIPKVSTIVTEGANPLSIAINAASSIGGIYSSYRQYKNQISEEYDEKMFELQLLTEDNLDGIYRDLNSYTFNLIKRYGISDEWRLNESELRNMFKYIKDSDVKRAYTNLKNMSEGRFVQHFPMFWYHLAKIAYSAGDEAAALRYYNRFESENIEIFRYDRTAVDAYKGKIAILVKNIKANRNEIVSKLAFIERNKTSWNDYYFCALVYAQLGDNANARRLLNRNISELSSEVDNQFLYGSYVDSIFAESAESGGFFDGVKNLLKNSENSSTVESAGSVEYDALELSRALLAKLNVKDSTALSENSIKKQFENDTQSQNEVLYFFGENPSAEIVRKSIQDAKKLLLSTKILSEKKYRVDVKIPLQWVLSANTDLLAVFYRENSNEPICIPMKIDGKESKKLKKASRTTPRDTVICYTTGDFNIDWKKEKCTFGGILLNHNLYPVQFEYSVDIKKTTKDIEPYAICFNKKEYKL